MRRSNRSTIALIAMVAIWSCAKKPEAQREQVRQYALAGEVVRLDPHTRVAAIRHGDIHDDRGGIWMKAMTMEFPVRDAQEFNKLQVGERIRGTVFRTQSDDYWIGGIEIERGLRH